MPTPCANPGCPEVTRERYCTAHAKAEQRRYDKQRGTAAERGYGYRWQKARKRFLRDNPLCSHCEKEGQVTPATVVDHIVPHKGDKALFWDRSNWQGLCEHHHNVKTAREDGGFGNG